MDGDDPQQECLAFLATQMSWTRGAFALKGRGCASLQLLPSEDGELCHQGDHITSWTELEDTHTHKPLCGCEHRSQGH